MLGLLTRSSSHPVTCAEKQEDHSERPKLEVAKEFRIDIRVDLLETL